MEKTGADVAIVGASAAGLAAAIAAAEAGARVTLLEAKALVGEPPAPAAIGFDHLWPQAIAREGAVARRRLPGLVVRAPTGRGPFVEAPLTVFDRTRLDQALAKRAQAAGAHIVTGVQGLVRVPGALRWRAGEVAARVVVFADGPFSLAREVLRAQRDPTQMRWGAILEGEGDVGERVAITLGHHARGGRSQLNPVAPHRWTHWTFYKGAPTEAEAAARAAFALDARLRGLEKADARFVGVAADPVYVLPGELARGRFAAVGGAAGQGGLEAGLGAGLLAGEAAAREASGESGALEGYARAWRAAYAGSYRRLRLATDVVAALDDRMLAALLGRLDGQHLRLDEATSLRALALRWARG